MRFAVDRGRNEDDPPSEGTEQLSQRRVNFNHVEPPIAWWL
jgi:hypothetical protein